MLEVAAFSRNSAGRACGQDEGIKVKSQEGGRNPLFQTQQSLGQTHKRNETFLKHSKIKTSAKPGVADLYELYPLSCPHDFPSHGFHLAQQYNFG